METIADRIKILRKDLALTQKNFAERLGVTNAHISRLEKGITEPSEALAKLICREFEVNMNWLKKGEPPMYEIEFDVDGKMNISVALSNEILKSDSVLIRYQFAELNVLFTHIVNTEFKNEDLQSMYFNTLTRLFTIIKKYTSIIKDAIATGQQTLDEVEDMYYTNYKNDLQDYVDELRDVLSFLKEEE